MTITLTREEAQQVLDVIERNSVGTPRREASELLRARLAQPEPEPHGYLWFTRYMEQRFTHRKPEELERIGEVTPVFAAPPQREWQGLTDEEINTIAATPAAIPGSYVHSFALAIEAKLKEKNS